MIWIVPPDPGALGEAIRSAGPALKWAYLGDNVAQCQRAAESLEGKAERIRTAGRLQKIAANCASRTSTTSEAERVS